MHYELMSDQLSKEWVGSEYIKCLLTKSKSITDMKIQTSCFKYNKSTNKCPDEDEELRLYEDEIFGMVM